MAVNIACLRKVFISLPLLKDNFSLSRILGCFFSPNTLNIPLYFHPACVVFEEKTEVVLILDLNSKASFSFWLLSRFALCIDFLQLEYGMRTFSLFDIYLDGRSLLTLCYIVIS